MGNIFITGTDTNVGKTVVTAMLVKQLRHSGIQAVPYKPIQTGLITQSGEKHAPDVLFYKQTNDLAEHLSYNTYLFEKACSPHLAASLENTSISLAKINKEIQDLEEKMETVVIEGAGGLYVPLNESGVCMIDLIEQLHVPAIIVARAGVGTINHTTLTVSALRAKGIPIIGVILNNLDHSNEQLIADNTQMIERLCDLPVLGALPFYEDVLTLFTDQVLQEEIAQAWKLEKIVEVI